MEARPLTLASTLVRLASSSWAPVAACSGLPATAHACTASGLAPDVFYQLRVRAARPLYVDLLSEPSEEFVLGPCLFTSSASARLHARKHARHDTSADLLTMVSLTN